MVRIIKFFFNLVILIVPGYPTCLVDFDTAVETNLINFDFIEWHQLKLILFTAFYLVGIGKM